MKIICLEKPGGATGIVQTGFPSLHPLMGQSQQAATQDGSARAIVFSRYQLLMLDITQEPAHLLIQDMLDIMQEPAHHLIWDMMIVRYSNIYVQSSSSLVMYM